MADPIDVLLNDVFVLLILLFVFSFVVGMFLWICREDSKIRWEKRQMLDRRPRYVMQPNRKKIWDIDPRRYTYIEGKKFMNVDTGEIVSVDKVEREKVMI